MTSKQLDLLLEYIARKIQYSELRTSEGKSRTVDRLTQIIKELEATTKEE